MTYVDKLKDPRWQKKRLEIFERDNFICSFCGENKKTLHVHHLKYIPESNPWESKNEDLETLCEDCHLEVQGEKRKLKEIINELNTHGLYKLLDLLTHGYYKFCNNLKLPEGTSMDYRNGAFIHFIRFIKNNLEKDA